MAADEKSKAPKAPKAKEVVYYSPHRKQGVAVTLVDEGGKKIIRRDAQGNPIMRRGRYQYESRTYGFLPLVESPKKGFLCSIKVDPQKDPLLYTRLEEVADDKSTKVIRQAEHEKKTNPNAYALKKQLDAAGAENVALSSEVAKKDSAISEMQKQIEELTKPAQAKGK